MKKTIFIVSFLSLFILATKYTHAVCNFHSSMTSSMKNLTGWSSTCTVAGIEGIDNPSNIESATTNSASLTISGGAVTINNGGILKSGSINMVGGTIAIQQGGQLKTNSPLYVIDSDGDGWPVNFTLFDSTGSGKRRLGLMKSYINIDCTDSIANDTQTMTTYYRDIDSDGYGSSASGTTTGCSAPTGYVQNNSDCGDGNANAKPGSTYCSQTTFTNNSGNQSFDWNCSTSGGAGTSCGTVYYSNNPQTNWKCVRSNFWCAVEATTNCIGAPVSCGAAGYVAGPGWGYYGWGQSQAPGENCCFNNELTCTTIGTSGTQTCQ